MAPTILSDEIVSSTELGRHAGSILKKAAGRPVTVKSKWSDLVILRREWASRLFEQEAHLGTLDNVMTYFIERCVEKKPVPGPNELRWMDVFEDNDVLDFLKEYIRALNSATEGLSGWDSLDNTIYEWRESAIALHNTELQENIGELRKEQRLGPSGSPKPA
jgi:hypothetical protein